MERCLVTRIVRDSILDGPGCRYVVFVKGCHLRCPWCHNPETQSSHQEILRYPQFCIKCKRCVLAGPPGTAQDILPIKMNSHRLSDYFPCARACPTDALEFAGIEYGTDELMKDMLKYRTVYKGTQGGLTISGGEPLFTQDFSFELFTKAWEAGFHTAIDTSGSLAWPVLQRFLPVVNTWLYDLKHTNDQAVKSALAIENLLKLAAVNDTHIWVRIPLVPGYNDRESLWQQMARLLEEAGKAIEQVALLPFHPYGNAKYAALDRENKFGNHKQLDEAVVAKAREIFMRHLPPEIITMGRGMLHG